MQVGVPALASRVVTSFISDFALPSLIAPLVPLPPSLARPGLVPPPAAARAAAAAAAARPGGGAAYPAFRAVAHAGARDDESDEAGLISQQLLQPKLLALLLLAHCLTVLSH